VRLSVELKSDRVSQSGLHGLLKCSGLLRALWKERNEEERFKAPKVRVVSTPKHTQTSPSSHRSAKRDGEEIIREGGEEATRDTRQESECRAELSEVCLKN